MTCFVAITVLSRPADPGSGSHLWAKRTRTPGFCSGAVGYGAWADFGVPQANSLETPRLLT